MNKKHIKKKIELYQDMLNGATIECQGINYDPQWWRADHVMDGKGDFNFKQFKYRAVYPKLTADVFSREDCPEWAKYAAVCGDGKALFFDAKPFTLWLSGYWICNMRGAKNRSQPIGEFDATDWQNSLIERPVENNLPEWCKVGTKVYVKKEAILGYPSFRGVGIQTIKEICGNNILITNPENDEVVSVRDHTFLLPAVYVLPTVEEIFQRSSLVVKSKGKDPDNPYNTITRSSYDQMITLSHNKCFSISELDKHFTWADGASIGKWVKVAE